MFSLNPPVMHIKNVFFCSFFFLSGYIGAQNDSAYVQEIQEYQAEQNREFADAEESPLTKEDRKEFTALEFFDINKKYRIEAKFVRTPDEKPFEMPTTTDRKPVYVKYGEAHFSLDGKSIVLNLYQSMRVLKMKGYEDYLFLPFNDQTNGFGSYGGGRFLDLKIPEGDSVIIDFNKAYNPYCAYNDKYSCPIPPEQNKMPIEILAGVKDYGHH